MIQRIVVSIKFWVLAAFLQTTLGKISVVAIVCGAVLCLGGLVALGLSFVSWIYIGCLVLLVVCVRCYSFILTVWSDETAREIISLHRNYDAEISLYPDDAGGVFGYRVSLDKAHYFLALKLQRPRSYSFPGCQRIPQSARVVILEFVDNELDVLWAFRDSGWTRFG